MAVKYEEIKGHVKNIARKYSEGLYTMDADDMEQELWIEFSRKNYENAAIAVASLKNKAIDIYRSEKNKQNRSFSYDFSESIADTIQYGADEVNSAMGYSELVDDMDFASVIEEAMRYLRDCSGTKSERNKRERDVKYIVCKGYLSCGIEYFKDECIRILEAEIPVYEERIEFLRNPKCGTDDLILKNVLHIKTGTNSGTIRAMKWLELQNFRAILSASINR